VQVEIKALEAASFAPYGKVLEIVQPDAALAEEGRNEFKVVDESDNADGWRLAVQIVRGRELRQLGHHPNTKETFEPVSGVAVICVAAFESPEQIEAFVLDRPVVVNAKVWHGMIALSREAVVKIAENREVVGVNQVLPRPLRVVLGEG
jgi:ureidoglycolate hydrolase